MLDEAALITGLTEGWAGNIDALIAVYDPNCRFEDKVFNIVHHGHAGIREVHDFSFGMMPDFRVDYGRRSLTHESGAVEWVFTGSFTGEFAGKTYHGRSIRVEGISFMTFRAGQILTNTDYWNAQSLAAQLTA